MSVPATRVQGLAKLYHNESPLQSISMVFVRQEIQSLIYVVSNWLKGKRLSLINQVAKVLQIVQFESVAVKPSKSCKGLVIETVDGRR